MRWLRRVLWGAVAIATTVAPVSSGGAQDVEMSTISGSVDSPRRHFRLRHPARLSPDEAASIYAIVLGALAKGYARSGSPVAGQYQQWRRFNRAPYPSVTHGNHYLNNYANRLGQAYARYEEAGTFPPGAVIAKDSFSMARTGSILLGPLFVMQKMPSGFNYASGDWKYSLISPDGTLIGETNGQGSQRVEYCISCHIAVEEQDHLFFVPEGYRIEDAP